MSCWRRRATQPGTATPSHEAGNVATVLAVSQRLIVFFLRTVIQLAP